MSAETFGFKINANGKALKKKQVWILEPSKDGDTVVLRSHLNKYLAVDQFGNVICDQVTIRIIDDFLCSRRFREKIGISKFLDQELKLFHTLNFILDLISSR